MAQALVRFLAAQKTVIDGETVPIFAGVWAIFGHGNVAGMGEALYARARRAADLPRATTSSPWRTPPPPLPRRCGAAA